LIAEDDHDGRVGAEEFLRAANLLHATAPERVDFNPATSDSASLADELKSERPDAIVLWVSREAAATLQLSDKPSWSTARRKTPY
jgi:ABC-type branched-subunit amino acid transport system substrate-binding protein